jgi:hypothetical protein
MNGAVRQAAIGSFEASPAHAISELALARIGADGGATRADIQKSVGPLASHRLSPSELRRAAETGLEFLEAGQLVCEKRGRYQLSEAGEAYLVELLGEQKLPKTWPEIRDVRLLARALGMEPAPRMLKAMARPDGLRAVIVQRHYGISPRRILSASRLRMSLAVVALERAFGNKIKTGLDAGKGLSVKASRLLAGQLAQRPRDFGTDTRLITALAAEVVGAAQPDPASLRQAVLRNYVSELLGDGPAGLPSDIKIDAARAAEIAQWQEELPLDGTDLAPEEAANDAEPVPATMTPHRSRPSAANRPDLAGFADIVRHHADQQAGGWPGNRKAFISRVWHAIAAAHDDWGLSEIEFKSMLAEAHRTGHIVLASADIKNKANLAEVQDSAITYKNTVWHFVRVET